MKLKRGLCLLEMVGPVLQASGVGNLLSESLRAQNPGVEVIDRGSYLRIQAPGICTLNRDQVEAQLGHEFHFPEDLEAIMSSFQGRMAISEDKVIWYAKTPNT